MKLKTNTNEYLISSIWKTEWFIIAVFWSASSKEKQKKDEIAKRIPIDSFDLKYIFYFSTDMGSNLVWNQLILKYKWGPVDLPVDPTVPITSPLFILSPTETITFSKCE